MWNNGNKKNFKKSGENGKKNSYIEVEFNTIWNNEPFMLIVSGKYIWRIKTAVCLCLQSYYLCLTSEYARAARTCLENICSFYLPLSSLSVVIILSIYAFEIFERVIITVGPCGPFQPWNLMKSKHKQFFSSRQREEQFF